MIRRETKRLAAGLKLVQIRHAHTRPWTGHEVFDLRTESIQKKDRGGKRRRTD